MRTSLNPLMYKPTALSKLWATAGSYELNLSPATYMTVNRGAGGAGGTANGGSAGCGGSATLSIKMFKLTTAQRITVVVGAGGQTKSNGGNGGNGGTRGNRDNHGVAGGDAVNGCGGGGGMPTYISFPGTAMVAGYLAWQNNAGDVLFTSALANTDTVGASVGTLTQAEVDGAPSFGLVAIVTKAGTQIERDGVVYNRAATADIFNSPVKTIYSDGAGGGGGGGQTAVTGRYAGGGGGGGGGGYYRFDPETLEITSVPGQPGGAGGLGNNWGATNKDGYAGNTTDFPEIYSGAGTGGAGSGGGARASGGGASGGGGGQSTGNHTSTYSGAGGGGAGGSTDAGGGAGGASNNAYNHHTTPTDVATENQQYGLPATCGRGGLADTNGENGVLWLYMFQWVTATQDLGRVSATVDETLDLGQLTDAMTQTINNGGI